MPTHQQLHHFEAKSADVRIQKEEIGVARLNFWLANGESLASKFLDMCWNASSSEQSEPSKQRPSSRADVQSELRPLSRTNDAREGGIVTPLQTEKTAWHPVHAEKMTSEDENPFALPPTRPSRLGRRAGPTLRHRALLRARWSKAPLGFSCANTETLVVSRCSITADAEARQRISIELILLHLPQAELVCDIVATIMLQQLIEKIKSDRFLSCARCLN